MGVNACTLTVRVLIVKATIGKHDHTSERSKPLPCSVECSPVINKFMYFSAKPTLDGWVTGMKRQMFQKGLIVKNGSGGESTTGAKGLPVWVALGRMSVIGYWESG